MNNASFSQVLTSASYIPVKLKDLNIIIRCMQHFYMYRAHSDNYIEMTTFLKSTKIQRYDVDSFITNIGNLTALYYKCH